MKVNAHILGEIEDNVFLIYMLGKFKFAKWDIITGIVTPVSLITRSTQRDENSGYDPDCHSDSDHNSYTATRHIDPLAGLQEEHFIHNTSVRLKSLHLHPGAHKSSGSNHYLITED